MAAKRPGRKRLAVDIPLWLAVDILKIAKRRNITITKWVIRSLIYEMKKETKFDNGTEGEDTEPPL